MRIKFICLNLWEGGKLMEPVLEFLKKEDADVLALQEANDGQDPKLEARWRSLQVIHDELPYSYSHFAPAFGPHNAPRGVRRGNAIFSKFPIRSAETIFFDVPFSEYFVDEPKNGPHTPRNLEHAVIAPQGSEINVFNVQGIWGTDGKDNERRLAMADRIAGAISGKKNVILAGDFNVDERTETIGRIEGYLVNPFKGERKTSFNMKRKSGGGFGEAVVDMLFVSPDIGVIERRCPEIDVSDHLPLVAVLEFKN